MASRKVSIQEFVKKDRGATFRLARALHCTIPAIRQAVAKGRQITITLDKEGHPVEAWEEPRPFPAKKRTD